RDLERGLVVVADPVQLRAAAQKELRDLTLASAAGVPESVRDLLRRRRRSAAEVLAHVVLQAEGGGLPERRASSALEQTAGRAPLPWRVRAAASSRSRCSSGSSCDTSPLRIAGITAIARGSSAGMSTTAFSRTGRHSFGTIAADYPLPFPRKPVSFVFSPHVAVAGRRTVHAITGRTSSR